MAQQQNLAGYMKAMLLSRWMKHGASDIEVTRYKASLHSI